MADNPDELLRRAAARPHDGPDIGRLRARAARRRKLRRTGAALSAIAVLGVGSAAAVTLSAPGDDEISLQEPADPAASPTPEASPSPLDRPDDDLVPETDAIPGEGSEPEADADTDSESDDPPFPANTEPDERPGAADQEMAVLSRVRVGTHDGYDRVVWEFSEGDRPRVRVEYVDQPRQPGSGDPVDVAGGAYLRLIAEFATDRGAELYAPGAQPYEGPARLDGGNAQAVREIVALGDFEANMQWAIGVDQQRPFRIRMLEDPLRIAVDVRHR